MGNLLKNIKKVLVLGPHPDDMEFGCVGTILKLLENKTEIHLAVFSMCEKSVPKGLPKNTIKKEMLAVTNELRFKKDNLHLFNYKVRNFPNYRQNILEDMVVLNKKIKPELVFLPSSTDIHQDHQTIHNEGKRAFKMNMLLGYEMPWNNFNFHADLYVCLDEKKAMKKIELLNLYSSQKFRFYNQYDFLISLLKIRGAQIQTPYAEAFEVIRLID